MKKLIAIFGVIVSVTALIKAFVTGDTSLYFLGGLGLVMAVLVVWTKK